MLLPQWMPAQLEFLAISSIVEIVIVATGFNGGSGEVDGHGATAAARRSFFMLQKVT